MEIIKKLISLSSLRSYKTPLIYEFLSKELKVKGCLDLNTKQIILQNAEDFDQNWGKIESSYIGFNIFLTQNIDDMGLFTDVPYVDVPANYGLIIDKFSGYTGIISSYSLNVEDPANKYFARFSGNTSANFFASGGTIHGLTDSKLYSVTSYISDLPFIIGLNFNTTPGYFTGVNKILVNFTGYTIDAFNTDILNTGLQYKTYNYDRLVYNSIVDQYYPIPYTEFTYQSQGWNDSNTSLSALTKQEIYFGVVFPPKIDSNLFIDRNSVPVFENQSRLGPILSVDLLELYGNGYYNVIK